MLIVRLSIVFVLVATGAAAATQPTRFIEWKDTTPLPAGLGGHVAAVVGGRVMVFGGTNWVDGKKYSRDQIWSREETTGRWLEAGKLPTGLAFFGSGVDADSLWIAGGWTQSGPVAASLRWHNGEIGKSTLPDLPAPRALMGSGSAGGSFYVIGGLTDPVQFKTALTSVMQADLQTQAGTWKEVAPLPRPLGLMASVSLGGKLFVFGGRGPVGPIAADSADAFRYDPQNDHWTKLAPLPAARRGAAGVAIDDRHILIIGGCHGDEGSVVMLDEVLLYDVQADSYAQCTPLPFAALCEQAVMWRGNVLVIGGEDKPRHRTDRVVMGTFAPVK